MSFRLCCRAGPILNLTWSDVHTIKKTGYLETDHHKTGRLYDVTIKIEQDQFRWLNRLKNRFVREFRTEPKYVFSSSNKVEHSMAKNLKTVLSQLFNKDHSKDFHATAVRKIRDTHFHKNRKKMNDSVFNAHLHQTGHTAGTALQSYVVPGKQSEVLKVYLSEMSKLQEGAENGIEMVLETGASTSTPKMDSTPKSKQPVIQLTK